MSNSETIARPHPTEEGIYLLSGFKFFTSGTNSDIAMVLARIVDSNNRNNIGIYLIYFLN